MRALKNKAVEATVTATELLVAQEVFVTNALLGVMPVSQVDDRRYDLAKNPVTRELLAVFGGLGDKV